MVALSTLNTHDGSIAKGLDYEHDENGHVLVDADTTISPWQCIKQNPKIVLITLWANIGSIMVGYDNLSLSVCLAMPAFQKVFASQIGGKLVIEAGWQAAWGAMYNVMTLIGSLVAAQLQDIFGRRAVFLSAIIFAVSGTAVNFVAKNSVQFLGGKILTGFSIGLVLTVAQTYISEIAPLPMRSIALSFNTIAMNLGMLIAISATFGRIAILEESAFRVIFAAAWVFPALLAIGLPFIPESPAWLVNCNAHAKARKSLEKLTNGRDPREVDSRLAQLNATAALERSLASESSNASFIDCFRGANLRRTLIVMMCNYMPKAVGAPLSANAPYFLNQTGLNSQTVVMLLEIGVSFGLVSAIANVFLLMRLRHRPLMFAGLILCVAMYLMMGICGTMARTPAVMLVIGIAVQVTPFSYGPSVGSSNAVAGETSALRLRSKTLGIGTAFQFLASTVWLVIIPYLINSDQLNLGGNIGWIYVVQGILYLSAMYFFVPGTKGRSYEELDVMFEKGISARKFEKWTPERTDV